MNLVLEVMGQNAQGLAGSHRKVFGVGGGSIGRAPECDWVLASPYISRHHATVCCINGVFYIESTGENGVAVNTPQSVLPQLERRALQSGDRLFIDEYEISVGVSGVQIPDDPDEQDFPHERALDPFGVRESVPANEAMSEENLDPLLGLAGGGSTLNTAPRKDPAWNHSSSLADHFTPPPVVPLAPNVAPIAEDWNQTEFNAPQRVTTAPRSPAQSVNPDPRAPRPTITQWPPVTLPPQVPPAQPWSSSPQGNSPPSPSLTQPRSSVPQGASPPQMPPSQPWSSLPQGAASAQRSSLPDPLAPAAQASQPPAAGLARDYAPTMDAVMRNMVQGLIEVLRARAEFRNQFRLPVTRVRTVENNPLKFAINAEDAMDSLMNRRNAGFMPAAEAFEDAFDDIRFHQLAMLAGMRAGFECIMSRFDPQKLQERFDRQLKHSGFLAVTSKLRYWDLYADWFEELANDADGAYQRLFGEEFASAYERQLETLKRNRGNPRH